MTYYSPKRNLNQICPKLNKTYTTNFYSKYIDKNIDNNNLEKSIDNINDYKIYNKRERASPFYRNEKSIRLQEEIDWMNNIVAGKYKINKMHGSNSFCDLINLSRNNMNGSLCYMATGEQLNDVKNRINRRRNSSNDGKFIINRSS